MSRVTLLSNVELKGAFIVNNKIRPSSRCQSTFTLYYNYIYLIGGVNNERLMEFWVCDLKNGYEWISIVPEGEQVNPRMGHTTVLYKNLLYIYGGNIKGEATMPREDIAVYDISKLKMYNNNYSKKRTCC